MQTHDSSHHKRTKEGECARYIEAHATCAKIRQEKQKSRKNKKYKFRFHSINYEKIALAADGEAVRGAARQSESERRSVGNKEFAYFSNLRTVLCVVKDNDISIGESPWGGEHEK